MSSHSDDPRHENPDSFPPSDDAVGVPDPGDMVGHGGFPFPDLPTRGFPDSYAELHGDVRRGQEPPEEQD